MARRLLSALVGMVLPEPPVQGTPTFVSRTPCEQNTASSIADDWRCASRNESVAVLFEKHGAVNNNFALFMLKQENDLLGSYV